MKVVRFFNYTIGAAAVFAAIACAKFESRPKPNVNVNEIPGPFATATVQEICPNQNPNQISYCPGVLPDGKIAVERLTSYEIPYINTSDFSLDLQFVDGSARINTSLYNSRRVSQIKVNRRGIETVYFIQAACATANCSSIVVMIQPHNRDQVAAYVQNLNHNSQPFVSQKENSSFKSIDEALEFFNNQSSQF